MDKTDPEVLKVLSDIEKLKSDVGPSAFVNKITSFIGTVGSYLIGKTKIAAPYFLAALLAANMYQGCVPNPVPVPDPVPVPTPTPTPTTPGKTWLIFLYDASNDSPTAAAIRTSKDLRNQMVQLGYVVSGNPMIRIYEKTQDEFAPYKAAPSLPSIAFKNATTKNVTFIAQPTDVNGVITALKGANP